MDRGHSTSEEGKHVDYLSYPLTCLRA
jgi:platelet-activating factor acetylhydrolase IB subunit alpha